MLNVSFHLHGPVDRKGLQAIFLTVTFNGNRIRKALPSLKINPNNWHAQKQKVIPDKKEDIENRSDFINSEIANIKKNALRLESDILKFKHLLTRDLIWKYLFEENYSKTPDRDFFDLFDRYIEKSKTEKKERTVKGIITVKNFLKDFACSDKVNIRFENIDIEFFETFRTYCYIEKNIEANYFSKIISVLKAFLSWSALHEYHQNFAYKKFSAPEKEKEVICLTIDELNTLYHFDFKSVKLNHVRDVFCFGCFTGLRWIDIKSLNSTNINGDYIFKRIEKTLATNSPIPLSSFAHSILEKYKGTIHEPLPVISSQKFNNYIKECCQMAGINSKMAITHFKGGQAKTSVYEKWELITSHVARKTFVTTSLSLGMSEAVVKAISGHKKQEAFRRYVNIANSTLKDELNKKWSLL